MYAVVNGVCVCLCLNDKIMIEKKERHGQCSYSNRENVSDSLDICA